MPKAGELAYVSNIGAAGVRHALGKPFSDPECSRYLLDLGAIFAHLPPPPARLLDLGCGTGWTSAFIALRGYDVTAVDIAPDMIGLARRNQERWGADNIEFVAGDYEETRFAGAYDAVVFYDSLHHAEDENRALAGAFRALKAGGVCLTCEPGDGHARAAQEIAQRYGVTEKDMPPWHIMEIARTLGFRAAAVVERPQATARCQYPKRGFAGWRWAKSVLRPLFFGWRERRRLLRGNHIVLLQK
ncbi:MAG: class I SAM-dependent methyltransferase [Gemmataceae bacterium]|nr:class I SAM-dependent methyltransferase [Gemmataceae bacterium]MCI0737602.1 class I SAM-dependent methyltransferase [Gemmataceae bacterium]